MTAQIFKTAIEIIFRRRLLPDIIRSPEFCLSTECTGDNPRTVRYEARRSGSHYILVCAGNRSLLPVRLIGNVNIDLRVAVQWIFELENQALNNKGMVVYGQLSAKDPNGVDRIAADFGIPNPYAKKLPINAFEEPFDAHVHSSVLRHSETFEP